MPLSKMKRLTLVTLKADARRITEKLMWLGCVEIESISSDAHKSTLPSDTSYRTAGGDVKTLDEASAILVGYGNMRRGIFSPLPVSSESDFKSGRIGKISYREAVESANSVIEKNNRLTEIGEEIRALNERSLALLPLRPYEIPLSLTETEHCEIALGAFPSGADLCALTERLNGEGAHFMIEKISSDGESVYVFTAFIKENKKAVLKAFAEYGFTRLSFPDMQNTPSDCLSELKAKKDQLESNKKSIEKSLISDGVLFDALQTATDMANTSERLEQTEKKHLKTDSTVIISGWIPSERVKYLQKALKSEPVFLSTDDAEQGDDVPVNLVNKRPAAYFETVVNMYSPPAYKSFDPTRIMAVFFFIIFGLMLADAVYGILIIIGSLFIMKRSRASLGVKKMCGLFACCGVSCTLFGILFGSYLGDFPTLFMKSFFDKDIKVFSVLDVMDKPIVFLVISLLLGAVHLMSGIAIKFYVDRSENGIVAALFDEGSLMLIFFGAGLFFINSLLGATVALLGAAVMVLTQGRRERNVFMKAIKGVGSLYGIIGLVSDLLSYSRIMALGLSSAVVASVFNILATMGGATPLGMIILTLVLPLGHLLNLAINLLGAFVHTSRLQYVEFFGKFFRDGGRLFSPLTPDITHTEIISTEKTE